MAKKPWAITEELPYNDVGQRPTNSDHAEAGSNVRPFVKHGSSENYRIGEDNRVSLRPSTLVLMRKTREFLGRPYEAQVKIAYKVDGINASITMRKTHRSRSLVPGEYLDLELINFQPCGEGLFTEYLAQLEHTNLFPITGLWIDDVLPPRFQDFFFNRGYVKQKEKHNKICFFRYWRQTTPQEK
jgi:hypothetical protein